MKTKKKKKDRQTKKKKATFVDPSSFDYLQRDMNLKPGTTLADNFVSAVKKNTTTLDFQQKLVSDDKK